MRRLPVFWCPEVPDDSDGAMRSISFTLADDWVAVDQDRFVIPVEDVVDADGVEHEGRALVAQYGAASLSLDLGELDPEVGDELHLIRTASRSPYLTTP